MMNLHSSRRDDRRKTKPSYGPRSERRCRGDQLLWKGDTPTSTNTAPVEYSVLVTNIPPCVNRVQLFAEFQKLVPVKKVILKTNHAYIHFDSLEEARKAVERNGAVLGGNQLSVELSVRTLRLITKGVCVKQNSPCVSCSEGSFDAMHPQGSRKKVVSCCDVNFNPRSKAHFSPACQTESKSCVIESTTSHDVGRRVSEESCDDIRIDSKPVITNNHQNNQGSDKDSHIGNRDLPSVISTLASPHNSSSVETKTFQAVHPSSSECTVQQGHRGDGVTTTASHSKRTNILTTSESEQTLVGFGRGKISQLFQQFHSKEKGEHSRVGRCHNTVPKHDTPVRLCGQKETDKTVSVSDNVEEGLASKSPLVPVEMLVNDVSCRGANEARSEDSTERQDDMSTQCNSLLFDLLETRHGVKLTQEQKKVLVNPTDVLGKTGSEIALETASPQELTGRLEVELQQLMQKNTAIKSELDSDTSEEVDDSIYEDVTPEWERVYNRFVSLHAKFVVKKEKHKGSLIAQERLLKEARDNYGAESPKFAELKCQVRLEEVQQEVALAKLENEMLLTKAELNLV